MPRATGATNERLAMRLLLIRHGHTADTDALVYAGQRDTPLSPLGERQAAVLATRLAGEPLAAVFTSDLARARATAEPIAAPHGTLAQPSPHLREIAMGAWEGQTYVQLARDNASRLEQWIRDPEQVAPPGGETVQAVRLRARELLSRQVEKYRERAVAWVTHGGVIAVLLCDLLGIPITQRWRLRCDLASITTVELWLPPESSPLAYEGSISCLNDTNHLAATNLQ
jgi:broad specificity phosphatase PhoE